MINVKKGSAHSLQQTDYRGINPNPSQYTGAGTVITAGELVYLNAGVVTAVPTTGGATLVGLKGFAINNSYDGDAIESQKIAVYALDGSSILETDQVDGTINASNYPIGTALYPSATTAGNVGATNGTAGNAWPAPIGWVEGIRFLQNATPFPSGKANTQNYTSATEAAAIAAEGATTNGQPAYTPSTVSATYKGQVNVPVLAIKLNVG
jgi:hypothetical protein